MVADRRTNRALEARDKEVVDLNTSSLPIALNGEKKESLLVLKEYADFWKIPYTLGQANGEKTTTVLSTEHPGNVSSERSSLIITPLTQDGFKKVAQTYNLGLSSRKAIISLPVTKDVAVSLSTTINQFHGPRIEPLITSMGVTILSRIAGTQIHLLSLDLVNEYTSRISAGLEDPPSVRFRLLSMLPGSYRHVPRLIRDRAFRSFQGLPEIPEYRLGPIECLRTIFLASIVTVSERPITKLGFWRQGKTYALSLTHDVETRAGLEKGAKTMLEVERELGVRSTWNLQSDGYPLDRTVMASLAEWGEVGSHDTVHDGRLAFLKFDEKVERLKRCREKLELAGGTRVRGFRAPLLQHSRELLSAACKAGYEFDSSVPSWEFLSPTSLKPHGVGTVFPFYINGILEIPVSLPQDHQLLRVKGLGPRETVDHILQSCRWVRSLGGSCVVLVHPDYELGSEENIANYQRLVNVFQKDSECDVMTLGELSRWWKRRSDAYVDSSGDKLFVRSDSLNGQEDDFALQMITGFDDKGFKMEEIS